MKWFLKENSLMNFITGIEKFNLDVALIEFCGLLFEKNPKIKDESLKNYFQTIKNNFKKINTITYQLIDNISNESDEKAFENKNDNILNNAYITMSYLAMSILEDTEDIHSKCVALTVEYTSKALAYINLLNEKDNNNINEFIQNETQKYINLFTSFEFINTLLDRHKQSEQDYRPKEGMPEDYYAL